MGSGHDNRVTGICLLAAWSIIVADRALAENIVVDAAPSHVANSFSPPRALGGAIDRLRPGTGAPSTAGRRPTREELERNTDTLLRDPVLKEILGAGWQTVSYRQNTELMVEAWHWNARGTWSDAQRQEGYFTGSAEPTDPIRHSWAYPLPHRGFSRGDGNGWSRLTDGDPKSYWKSNPYLSEPFTGEDDALHPQWVIVDLGQKVDVDALRIAWAEPYARRYTVQFWTGEREPFYEGTTKGTWQTFPRGGVTDGRGGTVTLKLVSWRIPVQYLRVWMTESSNTCDTHGSADPRNCLGYAVGELYAGTLSADGELRDVVKHLPSREQTVTWPSSVDPWHAASDLDHSRGDQIGFDLFFTSGITRGLPTMVPIAMLYATPEDAAAEIAYLYQRHYPISWIEMGEEADGQHMLPEDYGALYLQFATAIHRLVPEAKLGGPAFEGTFEDVEVWPDAAGKVSWIGRFFDYLKAHGRMSDFTFFSFEHYPFQDRKTPPAWSDLYLEPGFVSHIIQVWKDNGLPPNVPFFMTEGNMGGRSGPTDVASALWLADYVGSMMTGGASGTYYFHYLPSPGGRGGFLRLDRDYHVIGYPPQYLAAQVITREWVQPVDAAHRLFKVSSDVKDAAGNLLVTAYAVERPDGQWALMLVNRDHDRDHAVKVVFADSEAKRDRGFSGPVDRIVFGAAEYQWHSEGTGGHADPDGPPSRSVVAGGADARYRLPRASIVVLRGRIGGE
ncbi:MAG TPA: discoidin domain-containing protein [Vicinamibacteria bacterium]|nr:discoidin domain-containing protein [Vicinamibacteria bacterium]